MKMKPKHILNYLTNIIYPEKCLVCGSILPLKFEYEFLCSVCSVDIPWIKEDVCKKCGRHLNSDSKGDLCSICLNRSFAFERGHVVFDYETIESSIKHFKYKGFKKDGIGLGRLMFEYACMFNLTDVFESDIFIPVPIFYEKRKLRGFNQAEILSDELSMLANKPIVKDIIIRKSNTVPQSELSFEGRKKNILGAFEVMKKEEIEDKKIFLIDDIFTTGSTINECSRELYMRGAKEVSFFALSAVKDNGK